jgi:hypothetical protein
MAEEPKVEATHIVLSCIDHRCTDDVVTVMPKIMEEGNGGVPVDYAGEKYDHLALPGASLGVMQSAFPAWGEAFWQQLAVALELHPRIHTLVILDHMDCGAYKRLLPIGDDVAAEKEAHRRITSELAEEVRRRHSGLTVTRWVLEPANPPQKHRWHARDLQSDQLHPNVSCVHEGS